MLGAYYQNHSTQAIRGLGDQGQTLNLAEQTLQEMLTGKLGFAAVSALGVFTPWGVQTGDVSWQDLRNPEFDLLIQPLNDPLLHAAETASFGHPVGWLGILTDTPASTVAAQRAFDNTPYGLDMAEGVYNQADVSDPPRIRFLYWGKLREPDDAAGGRSSMGQAAKMLGGQLVFPTQVPRTQRRPHPIAPFQSALDKQMGIVPTGPRLMPLPQPVTLPVRQASAADSSGLPWWMLLGVGAAAAYGGYRLFRRKAA